MKNKLKPDLIQDIIKEAVEIEKKFISESLPSDLIGINSKVLLFSFSWWLNTLSV